MKKQKFYERNGVEEYYLIGPDHVSLAVFLRENGRLELVDAGTSFTSLRLGSRGGEACEV